MTGSKPRTRPYPPRRATETSKDISCGRLAPTHVTRRPRSYPASSWFMKIEVLNPHIEDIARRFALANFMAFAPDGLTSLGGYPGDDYKGGQMFNKIDKRKMFEDMVAAAMWLKSRPDCTGKIGATGFCYGGSTANTLAARLGADLAAAAPFYGGPPATQDIPKIKAAILVHQGELDTRLAATWPAYDQALTAGARSARRIYLPRRRTWLQLRRDAGTIQQGRGRSSLATHDRLVQQIRARLIPLYDGCNLPMLLHDPIPACVQPDGHCRRHRKASADKGSRAKGHARATDRRATAGRFSGEPVSHRVTCIWLAPVRSHPLARFRK
jgi:dienelactone hydrolase